MNCKEKKHNSESILLRYINNLTTKYNEAASQNEKKLETMRLTSDDINDISKQSVLDQVIAVAQENNATDLLLSRHCFIQNTTNAVFQSMKERCIQNEIIQIICLLQNEIKDLQEYKSQLDREFKSLNETEDLSQEFHEDLGLQDEIDVYESYIEKLRNTTRTDEKFEDWSSIIEDVKKKYNLINEYTSKIKEYESVVTEKYNKLPPNLLLCRNKLAYVKNKRDEVQRKISKLLEEN